MEDREFILEQLRKNRPPAVPLPAVDLPATSSASLLDAFTSVVNEIGGQVIDTTGGTIESALITVFPGVKPVFAREVEGRDDLSGLELFVCDGVLGVAENGAIWVPETSLTQRVAPFITQHLALTLDRTQIVAHMHAAYARIAVGEHGFGVFIAGPSKTADIEQSLVLGAHGPRSLTVLLT